MMLEKLLSFIGNTAWIYILLPCVMVGGIYFTIITKGLQFTKLGRAIRTTFSKMFSSKKTEDGAVSPFEAVATALAATVGTGNIIGTTQALAFGGYGAVFWMWVAALLGMIIKYAEVTLAVAYRKRNKNGELVGGPMYYIENGMGKFYKPFASAFALFAAVSAFGIGNLSQANSVSDSVKNALSVFFTMTDTATKNIELAVGVVLAVFVAFALIGGIKRISRLTSLLVPLMSLIFIICCLIVILVNLDKLTDSISKIVVGAFCPKAVMGGAGGIAMRQAVIWGLRRSAFSNEAGLGSAAIAHASADTNIPAEQGLLGIFEVFADTIVICTLIALAIIVSDIPISFGTPLGSSLITSAFATVFGQKPASLFITLALALFALSTLLGWSLYGIRSAEYLFGNKGAKIYKILFIVAIPIGAAVPLGLVWQLADTFNGLMAIPNFVALFYLSKIVKKESRAL